MIDFEYITIPSDAKQAPGTGSRLLLRDLESRDCFSVDSASSRYYFLVLDPVTSLVVCQGGTKSHFREPRVVVIDGAGSRDDFRFPGQIRSYYGMVLRPFGKAQPILSSSAVRPDGIQHLEIIPGQHEAFEAVALRHERSQSVFGDPEYVAAYQAFMDTVPQSLHSEAEKSIDLFTPRGRVMLLSIFQVAYLNGRLSRVLSLFSYQNLKHWSWVNEEVRGEIKTEADARNFCELCMLAGMTIPAQLGAFRATARNY